MEERLETPGIEGSSLQPGNRVVLLEDVTTTGGSALKAARTLNQMGCDVVCCITILDRQEGGLEAFEEAGINLIPSLSNPISRVEEMGQHDIDPENLPYHPSKT